MNKLDHLILGSFIPKFIGTFGISLFILVLQRLFVWMDEIIGKGLDWLTILELFFYLAAFLVPMALPLATLLASLMTYGNMGENSELVVIKASGTSLIKAMKGNIAFMIVISILTFLFSNYYLPFATLKSKILLYDIQNKAPAFNIKENVFYNDLEGYAIKVGQKEDDNKTIKDIIIYDYRSRKGNDNILIAKNGKFESYPDQSKMVFTLKNGTQYQEVHDKNADKLEPHSRIEFEEWEKVFDLSNFNLGRTEEKLFKNHYQMLNVNELNKAVDSIHKKKSERLEVMKKHLEPYNGLLFKKESQNISAPELNTPFLKTGISHTHYLTMLEKDKQKDVIKKAVSSCRSMKGFIDFAEKDLIHKDNLIKKHEVEWHRKFTISFSCMMFFFLGAPLGSIIRKGGFGYPFIITLLLYIIYHIVSISGEKFALKGFTNSFYGMWFGIFCFLPFSLLLTLSIAKENIYIRSWVIQSFRNLDLNSFIKKLKNIK